MRRCVQTFGLYCTFPLAVSSPTVINSEWLINGLGYKVLYAARHCKGSFAGVITAYAFLSPLCLKGR